VLERRWKFRAARKMRRPHVDTNIPDFMDIPDYPVGLPALFRHASR
jgi:hypothetical protein